MHMTAYRISFRFLFGFLAVFAAGGALLHAQYKRNVGRQADILLHLADAAEAKGEPAKAVGYLRRYLAFRPRDHAARGRLGLTFVRLAGRPAEFLQAYFVIDEALRGDPGRDDLRRKA